ncbi:unnamed protein product, partial [Prorocentrum cordatum]
QDPEDPQSELMKALGLSGKDKKKDKDSDIMKALGLAGKDKEKEKDSNSALMKALGLGGKDKEKEQDPNSALMKALGLGGKDDAKASAKDDDEEDESQGWLKTLQDHLKKASEGKHVKGAAEDLHKKADFAPEAEGRGISKEERKALQQQIAALKKQSEEAELKA